MTASPGKEAPASPGKQRGAPNQTATGMYYGPRKGQALPRSVLDVLAAVPRVLGSQSLIRWLLRAFRVLGRYYPPEQIVEILEEFVTRRREMEMGGHRWMR